MTINQERGSIDKVQNLYIELNLIVDMIKSSIVCSEYVEEFPLYIQLFLMKICYHEKLMFELK